MWEPVLVGESAAQARQAILDIAAARARGEGNEPRPHDDVLFWAYVAGAFEDDWISERYDAAIEKLGADMEAGFSAAALCYGAAGAGFAIAHVSEPGDAEQPLAGIDRLLLNELAVENWTGEYDLIGGLVGYGVYFLERGDTPDSRRGLARVIDHLIAHSTPVAHGRAWLHDGVYNCGVAHGIPGVAALLARAAILPGADPRYRTWAEETVRWIQSVRPPLTRFGRYPGHFDPEKPMEATRTAWCYGDPGIAITTYGAAARLGLPTGDAIALARECAARDIETSRVDDAAFCHGTGGLAHIFNRLYQASGDEVLREAARTWFRRTLDMKQAAVGVGGYVSWTVWEDEKSWQPSTTLITGASGIALALLASIEPTEPNWDRVFQCDLP